MRLYSKLKKHMQSKGYEPIDVAGFDGFVRGEQTIMFFWWSNINYNELPKLVIVPTGGPRLSIPLMSGPVFDATKRDWTDVATDLDDILEELGLN